MASSRHAFAITTSDGSDLAERPVRLYVGGTGDIKLELVKDTVGVATILKSVQVGSVLELQIRKIYATGTTATNLVGLT